MLLAVLVSHVCEKFLVDCLQDPLQNKKFIASAGIIKTSFDESPSIQPKSRSLSNQQSSLVFGKKRRLSAEPSPQGRVAITKKKVTTLSFACSVKPLPLVGHVASFGRKFGLLFGPRQMLATPESTTVRKHSEVAQVLLGSGIRIMPKYFQYVAIAGQKLTGNNCCQVWDLESKHWTFNELDRT